jgi:hypothetical protein
MEHLMRRLPICLAWLILSIAVLVGERAEAQYPGYRPPRPTLSPYFDLYRREAGPLGPYHSDFRPRQEFRRTLQQQGASLQQERSTISSLDRRMSLFERAPQGVRPTGTASVFMNYSHYYRLAGRSGSSGSRGAWSPASSRSGGSYSSY